MRVPCVGRGLSSFLGAQIGKARCKARLSRFSGSLLLRVWCTALQTAATWKMRWNVLECGAPAILSAKDDGWPVGSQQNDYTP